MHHFRVVPADFLRLLCSNSLFWIDETPFAYCFLFFSYSQVIPAWRQLGRICVAYLVQEPEYSCYCLCSFLLTHYHQPRPLWWIELTMVSFLTRRLVWESFTIIGLTQFILIFRVSQRIRKLLWHAWTIPAMCLIGHVYHTLEFIMR